MTTSSSLLHKYRGEQRKQHESLELLKCSNPVVAYYWHEHLNGNLSHEDFLSRSLIGVCAAFKDVIDAALVRDGEVFTMVNRPTTHEVSRVQ